MDIREQFLLAQSPEPVRCLGLTLKPYSLGHSLLLQRHGNGFLVGDGDYGDLISGVLICSQSWEEFQSAWLQINKYPKLSFWGMFLRVWGFLARRYDVIAEAEKFKQYVKAGSYWPDVNPPTAGKKMVCPWENRLKLSLMKEMKLTESEVLNRPLAQSHIDFCTIGEMNGVLEMFSEENEAFLNFHKNRIAQEQSGENKSLN